MGRTLKGGAADAAEWKDGHSTGSVDGIQVPGDTSLAVTALMSLVTAGAAGYLRREVVQAQANRELGGKRDHYLALLEGPRSEHAAQASGARHLTDCHVYLHTPPQL